MADLTNGSGVYQTYSNAGAGVAELGDNYANKAGNGIAGKTHLLSVATGSNMDGCIKEAQAEGFTVVGVEGTSNGDFLVLQGTRTPSITNATLEATIDQNPA